MRYQIIDTPLVFEDALSLRATGLDVGEVSRQKKHVNGSPSSIRVQIKTAYRLINPEPSPTSGDSSKPTVVVVHGATLGSVGYLRFQDQLVAAGYPCLMYDGIGRGYTDRITKESLKFNLVTDHLEARQPDNCSRLGPKCSLLSILAVQLDTLLKALVAKGDLTENTVISFIGVSLGGAVVTSFMDMMRTGVDLRIQSISYHVPVVGRVVSKMTWNMCLMLFVTCMCKLGPVVEKLLFRYMIRKIMLARAERKRKDESIPMEQHFGISHFIAQFRVKGCGNFMLSLLHQVVNLSTLEDVHARLSSGSDVDAIKQSVNGVKSRNNSDVPLQFIYARDDDEVDFREVEKVISLYERNHYSGTIDVKVFTGGHFMLYGNFEEVMEHVFAFFDHAL
ncbi:hypothetical protein CYMTET_6758 [Cymbomonas tetramitiformis]|uniref:Uncharacterized protein n=1 Tax=Cymbomonas tetramitiformis TaxID=36881 RepID=A0AAE0LHK8_9CHLO|nr:hypothetical protein CYMTET_6758 [Cymbomonas tetramitiformis]